jgi:4-alpha-glucanotransferase
MKRAAGILLHPTSLPSDFGIGDFGHEAFTWITMLRDAGQSYWQFLPLGPTAKGDSPYQCLCSFAGNPLLISPVKLLERGLLTKDELRQYPVLPEDRVDYTAVAAEKEKLYRLAFGRFSRTDDYAAFCEQEKYWLDNYALFSAIRDANNGREWPSWETSLKLRDKAVLDSFRMEHADDLRYYAFLQFIFHEQWSAVRSHASREGIQLIGDIPIYVAMESSDAWSSPELFEFDATAHPLRVSGVPPDYYSETGQLWGNPLYKWEEMNNGVFTWWTSRIRKSLSFADIVRIDHFRAFESFWAVAAGSTTAINGEWVKGPGMDLFAHIKKTIGSLPFIAEDLGIITGKVEKLRDEAGLPGMKVLQFAFDGNAMNPHLPYNIPPHSVVYTGTHDNDTTAGWLDTLSGVDRRRIDSYIGSQDTAGVRDIMRLAYATPAELCIIPLQDVLELDSSGRMNMPGKADGNWKWRCRKEDFIQSKLALVKEFAGIYGRVKAGKKEQE